MDQPKLERLLRLMKMLTANTEYTIDDLAERLMMSRRTVYRYIDTFREAGFVIKKSGEHIRLDKESPHFKDISQLIHFTEEEAVILKSAIENIDDDNLLKQNLKRKLYSVYDNRTLADTIVKGRLSGIVHNLVGAIAEKRQVVLQAYRSARGAAVRDRRVEPFAFTTNYVNIWCYDTEDGLCKLFKTSRIGAVLPLGDEWAHEAEHREGFMDVFRMNGHDRTASACGWGCWRTTCSSRSIRSPNATSRPTARATGCWRPKWRDSPASPVSSRDCSTTWRSSTRPS